MNRTKEAFALVREKGLPLITSLPKLTSNFKTLVTLTEAYVENVLAGSERKHEVEGDIAGTWVTVSAFARSSDRPFAESCEAVGQFLHECEKGNVEEGMPRLLVELIESRFTALESE
jgi:hypothetical protein